MRTCMYVLVLIYIVKEISGEIDGILPKQNEITNTTSLVTPAIADENIKSTTRRPFLPELRLPCSCFEGQCGCCTGMILERFRQKACLNITYEPDDFAFTARMTMNGRVLYKNTISGKNPPPVCIPVPRFRFITFCVEFSNIYFASRNIHMCIDAEASWEDFTLIEWSFDCIRLGANGVAVVGEEDGGGVPASAIDEEDQTDEDYDDSARNVPLIKYDEIKTNSADSSQAIVDNDCNVKLIDKNVGTDTSCIPVVKRKAPVSVQQLSNGDFLFSFRKE